MDDAVAALRAAALPLHAPDDLTPLVDAIGDKRVVLLGESTHGTAEYYRWRHAITERLAQDPSRPTFLAVEGDWPDCKRVDRYVKLASDASAREAVGAFDRWPTWMWANREIVELAESLRGINEGRSADRRVGFYGFDVYSLFDSMRAVVAFLDGRDPEAARAARRAYACFDRYGDDAQAYAAETRIVPENCEDEVVGVLAELRQRRWSEDETFDAEQNALVAANAEAYYRAMARGGPSSWNIRDEHMVETLDRLLDHHGDGSRAIVWAHNTHVGDARATGMVEDGLVNVGSLAREKWGDDVFAVGFGTNRGRLIAARAWDAPFERMPLPPARSGSWDAAIHDATEGSDALLLLGHASGAPLRAERGQRAVGVVYHSERESGNYVPTRLAERYDALLWLDVTNPVRPLHVHEREEEEAPETFPSGF